MPAGIDGYGYGLDDRLCDRLSWRGGGVSSGVRLSGIRMSRVHLSRRCLSGICLSRVRLSDMCWIRHQSSALRGPGDRAGHCWPGICSWRWRCIGQGRRGTPWSWAGDCDLRTTEMRIDIPSRFPTYPLLPVVALSWLPVVSHHTLV